jgi:SAM-dependent methyltransferase
VREALALYERVLEDAEVTSGPASPLVRFEDGQLVRFPVARYVGAADQLDLQLLGELDGPELDIGCGPGRHLCALAARGVPALGVDISQTAVTIARRGGGTAIVGDSFVQAVPGAGGWRTALLLDGNVGIGGDPVRLLTRVRSLLHPDGAALVELEPPGSTTRSARARIELAGESSGWFAWTRVAACEIAAVAEAAGLSLEREWSCGTRWFARLRSVSHG